MCNSGILLLATGHAIYGALAYNNLLTIRAMDTDTPVALAYDAAGASHLTEVHLNRFSALIPVDHKGFGGKLHLDLITPFERTLFIDADMAWMPKHGPQVLFDNLEGVEFTAITEGKINFSNEDENDISGHYYFWADTPEIKQVYGLANTMYQWRSEVMYFTKTERVQEMFKKAREIHSNPRLQSVKLFGGQIPDELALNIACSLHDIHPHQYKWTPAYWSKLHGEHVRDLEEIYNQYYLFSLGSHRYSPTQERIYTRLVRHAAWKLGLGEGATFPLKNKAEAIKDRLKF